MKKFLIKMVKVFFIGLISLSALAGLLGALGFGESTEATPTPTATPTPKPTALYPELEVVGLSDLKDVQTIENGNMTVIRAKTNDRQEYEVHITLEDGKVIWVQISGWYEWKDDHKLMPNGDIKTSSSLEVGSIVLFDDTLGGYLAVYDSKENTLKAYEK